MVMLSLVEYFSVSKKYVDNYFLYVSCRLELFRNGDDQGVDGDVGFGDGWRTLWCDENRKVGIYDDDNDEKVWR